eukprot:TRINITY_DN12550_c0_g2_i4.p7 TRINITY_DN12550_c0_g2~~TRINITY_DN12550_c0_g2_i4.p7  ORF type:complete len:119 (+),score=6.97 TRINITY_DN12550_c0_g2_i4:2594-2950(+)
MKAATTPGRLLYNNEDLPTFGDPIALVSRSLITYLAVRHSNANAIIIYKLEDEDFVEIQQLVPSEGRFSPKLPMATGLSLLRPGHNSLWASPSSTAHLKSKLGSFSRTIKGWRRPHWP